MSDATNKWTDFSMEMAKDLHDTHPEMWLYSDDISSPTEVCQFCKNVYPAFMSSKAVQGKKGAICAKTMGMENEAQTMQVNAKAPDLAKNLDQIDYNDDQ
jgi:hypothetical protein